MGAEMNDEDAELEGVTGFEAWHRVALHPTLAGAWLAGVDYGRAGREKELKESFTRMIEGALVRDNSLQKIIHAIGDL